MIGNDHLGIARTLWVQSNSDSDDVASACHLCGYRKDNKARVRLRCFKNIHAYLT